MPGGPLSRRAVLAGLGLLGVGAGSAALAETLPGGAGRVARELFPPDGPIGHVVRGRFDSRAVRRSVHWTICYPPGAHSGQRLPVALALHGRGGDASDVRDLVPFLSAAVIGGTPPFALASVDGGQAYWHRRADGTDAQALLTAELLPLLASRGLRTDRIGVHGTSMGGYGALLLAEDHPGLVAAVATNGAALWSHAADTAAGAFDSPADFARNDVLAHARRLQGIPVRIGCGRSDPFIAGNRRLGRLLGAQATTTFLPGGHSGRTWVHLRLHDLQFLGRHLS